MPIKTTTADGQTLTPKKIAGYRKSYREFNIGLRADISDDGEPYLIGAVYKTHPCGCRIIGNGTIQFPLEIQFCEKHQ